MSDPISEIDLLAYVDDQLDTARRIEVEDYLARHPEAAMQVMADLKHRDSLRLAFASDLPRPPFAMLEAAGRLERALGWRQLGLKLRRIAAMVTLVGLGWFAHAQGELGISDSVASPKPPAFVEDALHSHETALVRARMASQLEAPTYDPVEIRAETGIALPQLPDDWQVLDAQIFPSREGHSVELAIKAGELGRLSLFAAQAPAQTVIAPTWASFDKAKAVYWQTGHLAYAIIGTGSDKTMQQAALRLAQNLQ